jgi:hypothetical protein
VIRSIPTRDTRTQASTTTPLSNTRSRQSISVSSGAVRVTARWYALEDELAIDSCGHCPVLLEPSLFDLLGPRPPRGLGLGLVIAVLASAQTASAPGPSQTIVIEPIDATHVRLRLQGRENWTVESGAFTIQPVADSVNVIAQQGSNKVNDRSVAETFALKIGLSSSLGFEISNAKQSRRHRKRLMLKDG